MKLSLCNEVLRDLPFGKQCEVAAALGYDGLELAPFTVFDNPHDVHRMLASSCQSIAASHGLKISSLHWLLVRPEGMSMVSTDNATRAITLDWLRRMIEFAQASGASVLVHGSPAQRSPGPGQTVADALARLEDMLAVLAPYAREAGVTYCIEPLSPAETPVINTLAQASALVARIGSPALRTMLDVSAAAQSEALPIEQVVLTYLRSGDIAHVQVNDKNRKGPGQGDTDLLPLFQVLKQENYAGWVAVEPFIYTPDGVGAAAFAAGYVKGLWRACT
jgi:D-psicose/D-tagatose/L-ribulose 3-epimerase